MAEELANEYTMVTPFTYDEYQVFVCLGICVKQAQCLRVWLSIKSCSRSRENVNRIEPCHTKTGLNCRGHHDHSMNKEEELEDLFSSYVLMQHWTGYFFPF